MRVLRILILFAVAFGMAFAFTTLASANGGAVRLAAGGTAQMKITKGKPRTVTTAARINEIVVGDPDIADVSPLTDRSFFVLGRETGTTAIALFDENRQLVGTIDVEVSLDTDGIAKSIRSSVPGTNINVNSASGMIVLSGSAEDAVAAERARSIASSVSGDDKIINSVNITSSQQVQLNVRFVEINRQVGQELGTRIAASYVTPGGGIGFNSRPQSSSQTPASAIIAGLTSGGFSIDVAITALEDRGVARRLAEPNLIARSGERASFLAGGEFPIPVSSEEGRVTVEYKRFGVSLDFTPTVLSDGLISLDIEPEVSTVDTSTSYRVGEISIPGFVVRRARTSVDLRSGQSFMIAGLLQSQNDMNTQRVPGLGRLPVLGALFSSKAYQRRETDLVIIITPHLIQPMDPLKTPRTPADTVVAASNSDYFLGNVEEVRTPRSNAYAEAGAVLPAFGHFLQLDGR